jgi:glucokinase
VPQGGEWRVLPGEGGHLGFAPRSELEVDLWRALHAIEPRVDYERVVCGPGLKAIYRFLRERSGLDARGGPLAAPDPAAAIAQAAGDDPLAAQALDLFASVFGACAGDLALLANARGGVYLAGGIAPKVFDARREALFVRAFADKGSHARLMPAMPVSLVLEPRLGLLGAVSIAARSLGAERA